MPAYDKAVIDEYLTTADTAKKKADKGKTFEDLAYYLFSLVPGIKKISRNQKNTFETEEIDLCCYQVPELAGLMSLPFFFLVECKGWDEPVGSIDINWFLRKIPGRGLDFGILIAANGITGSDEQLTNSHFLVKSALEKGVRMIVITRNDIESLSTSEQFAEMIIEKLCNLHASCRCY